MDIEKRTADGRFAKGLTPRNKGGHDKIRLGIITERGQLNATPGSNRGRHMDKCKPIVWLTTGKRFASISEAAEKYDIPRNYISGVITRHGTVHGLKFEKLWAIECPENLELEL